MAHLDSLIHATAEELAGDVRGMCVAMGKRGWMLGTGCILSPETPEANVAAIRRAVEAV